MKLTPELDWSGHCAQWPVTLERLRGTDARALEVGAFEGRQSVWLADWLGPSGHVVCVDPFTGEGQWDAFYEDVNMDDVAARFFSNTAELRRQGRLTVVVGSSRVALGLLAPGFSVVYIDGDHSEAGVLHDAWLAARLVRVGGFMLFDDFASPDYPGVAAATRQFMSANAATWQLVHADYQLHLQRVG